MVLKYIGFKRRSGESTGSTFSALTVKREIQKKTAFDPGIPQLFGSTQFQLDFKFIPRLRIHIPQVLTQKTAIIAIFYHQTNFFQIEP